MKFTFQPEAKPLDGLTLKRAIARGGFGEVYYALTDAGKEVAVKLLQQNLDVELRGLQQCLNLKHPHLVTLFDIKTDSDGDHWVVMEYINGPTLEQELARYPQGMPLPQIERWLAGIAAGLDYLHDRGIVHRDLKPANLFWDMGIVKIGDVGLSKSITPSRRSAHTESVGTVYYMAPEVAYGRYGREVDLYSLGVILYEMLIGRVPFEGESTAEIMMKHLSQAPDLTPLPAAFRGLLGRMLSKDPKHRPTSLTEICAEFHTACEQSPGTNTGVPVNGVDATPTASTPLPQFVNGSRFHESTQMGTPPHPGTGTAAATESMIDPKVKRWLWDHRALAIRCATFGLLLFGFLNVVQAMRGETSGRSVLLLSPIMALGTLAFGLWLAWRLSPRLVHGMERLLNWTIGPDTVPASSQGWLRRIDAALVRVLDPRTKYDSAAPAESAPQIRIAPGAMLSKLPAYVLFFLQRFSLFVVLPALISFWVTGEDDIFFIMLWMGTAFLLIFGMTNRRPSVLPAASGGATVPPVAPERPAPPPQEPRRAPSESVPHAVPVARVVPATQRRMSPSQMTPNLRRWIPVRQRIRELCIGGFWGTLLTIVLCLGASWISPLFENFDPARVGLFTVTTLVGVWSLLVTSKVTEGFTHHQGARTTLQLAAGIVTGTVAWGVAQTLLVSLPQTTLRGEAMFVQIGRQPLLVDGGLTWLAYAVYFAGLFTFRKWWWLADSFRARMFDVGSVIVCVAWAWVLTIFLPFPGDWGMTWAAVIACVVQLSSLWVPPDQRVLAGDV